MEFEHEMVIFWLEVIACLSLLKLAYHLACVFCFVWIFLFGNDHQFGMNRGRHLNGGGVSDKCVDA